MDIDTNNNDFNSFSDILNKRKVVKPPAYEWQDLALRVIKEIDAPFFKRSAVFKICRDNPKIKVEQALNDTKELCKTGQKWMYFFKVIDTFGKPKKDVV
jgi:hypothetical protein